jgi:c-di-GMP-binding flagellar brake protein YcgR
MLQKASAPSRRFNVRITMPDQVWVCWHSNGRDAISRVRDISLGGLFVQTSTLRKIGTPAKLDFLVPEGQIRADAVVRHVSPGHGLGLKFTAVSDADRRHLAALMRRLRA